MIKIGINGFGRIGRLALRHALSRSNVEVVAINDLLSIEHLAYLFKFDSVHGRFKGTIKIEEDKLIINNSTLRITSFKNPEDINWGGLDIDYVIESTGHFTTKNLASLHLKAGTKQVVISAPSTDAPMFVMGVNQHTLTKDIKVFSNASCTTNCLAPILKVLNKNFIIEEALMSTIHCSTSSQSTVDSFSKNWRRGRSGMNNIIPTSTSAAQAINKIMPELFGKIDAMAFRVPIVDVSLIDVTVRVKKTTSYEMIKTVMKTASEKELKGILGYTDEAVVSQDFVSDPRTSIFDASAGMELNSHFFKIVAWYDNEFGYSTKLMDLIEYSSTLNS
jgi:glyceraldehyde 3-phosphate dehydrogenase